MLVSLPYALLPCLTETDWLGFVSISKGRNKITMQKRIIFELHDQILPSRLPLCILILMDQRHFNYRHSTQMPRNGASQNNTPSSQQILQPKRKQQRHRHCEQEWNGLRDRTTHLYIEEDKKAEEILGILKTQHDLRVGCGDCSL